MDTKDFERLEESVRQMVAIRRGEAQPSRSFEYEGKILLAIKENGETTWTLAGATKQVNEEFEGAAFESWGALVKTLRAAFNQTQEGFAQLLDIPLGTLQGWEQERRMPRGPARMLLRVAVSHPGAVLDAAAHELDLEPQC